MLHCPESRLLAVGLGENMAVGLWENMAVGFGENMELLKKCEHQTNTLTCRKNI
jgi:hypothetical protein